MTEKKLDKELEALKADIASLREDIAGLVTGVKRSAGMEYQTPHAAVRPAPLNGEEGPGIWTELLHTLDSSRLQGEKVVKGLAAEVEQRPLVSILAAFGLGYIIAKLWYQENTHEDTHEAP